MASRTHPKESSQGGWVKMTPAEVKAFSAEGKLAVKTSLDKIIERYMKPSIIQRQRRRATFGTVHDLYTKWHGSHLILIAKRRAVE